MQAAQFSQARSRLYGDAGSTTGQCGPPVPANSDELALTIVGSGVASGHLVTYLAEMEHGGTAMIEGEIEGKVVAITGASSGIGAATARRLAASGAKVVLGARRSERLAWLANEIADAGGQVIHTSTDVRHREDMIALVGLATERFGHLDVLVSNAGVGPISPLDDLRVDEWEAIIDTNIRGLLYGIAAALPLFRAQQRGHFVNIASTAAHRIVPSMAVYAAAKSAVRVISEGLRQEAGDKLRVTVISPGFIKTELASSINDPGLKEQIEHGMQTIAISPDAIAETIAFAIGQPIEVDIGEIIVRPTAQS
jgi:NADP-dependent 3-hydroxy acid dehydrogenase YdfG